jgi:hypothetical protein
MELGAMRFDETNATDNAATDNDFGQTNRPSEWELAIFAKRTHRASTGEASSILAEQTHRVKTE